MPSNVKQTCCLPCWQEGSQGPAGTLGCGQGVGRAPWCWAEAPRAAGRDGSAAPQHQQQLQVGSARQPLSPCPPRTAESPAVNSACWHPAAGDASSQTKHFCYSLTFHFQTSSKPAPQRPSLGPRGNISTPKLHFVPCVH